VRIGFSAHAANPEVVVDGLVERLVLPLDKKRGFVAAEVVVARRTVLAISHEGYGEIRWVSLIEKP
jgi:hypothetical protein